MGSSEQESVRVTKRGHRFVKDAKTQCKQVGTIQGFVERAVSKHAPYIQHSLRGTADIRALCERLSEIDGIELYLPEHSLDPRLVSEDLERRVLVELAKEEQEAITDIQNCTELDRSKIIRLCILRHLYVLTIEEELFEYPRTDTIEDAWLPAKKAIEATFPRLVHELHLQIVEQREFLQTRIERDANSGKRFRGHYENYFRHTTGYDRMTDDELGAEVIDYLEEMVDSNVW